MTLGITQSSPLSALSPVTQSPIPHGLSWQSVGTIEMSVGEPGEGEKEMDDFDENDFDDDFDDDFEEEVEDDEFESADPFQMPE